jgi:O-antigen/teichoic acid export membrane protein
MVGAFLAIISVQRLNPLRGTRQIPIPETRAILAFSWPLMLMTVVNLAWQESETVVLGILAPSDQVGIYYASARMTTLLAVFLTAFSLIFAPVMGELYAKNEQQQLSSLLKTVTRWGFTLCLPLFLLFFACSDQIVALLGPGFAMGAVVLPVLATAQLFNVITGPVGWSLIMSGRPKLNLLNSVLMLGLSFSLDLLLIPRYGIVGAAMGGALSIFLVNLLRLAEVYAILRIHPYNLSYLKPITAGFVAAIVVVGLRSAVTDLSPVAFLTLSALIVVLTFALTLLILGLEKDDRMVVEAIVRQLGRLVPRRAQMDRC